MEKSLKEHLYVLILCGGGGTRLWPRSRNKLPKQFAKLLGPKSLFQMTVERFEGFVSWSRIFVVTTTSAYGKIVQKQAPKIPPRNILVEPMRRNTAMAYGLGAAYIQKVDPEAVIITETADHPIKNIPVYLKNFLVSAQAAAESNVLVTTGIKPDFPHTGFGYIKRGRVWKRFNGQPVYKLEKFTEKPDFKIANDYLKSGDYFWHASLFVWRADSYLRALLEHEPRVGGAVQKIAKAIGSKEEQSVIQKAYKTAPEISVDYAVAERADNFYMVVGEFGWEDVGNWQVVYELLEKDKNGNAILKFGKKGKFIGIDAKNNLIQFDDQLIAAIGIEDLVIVDAGNIILVCRKDKAEEVKALVNFLKEKGKKDYL